MSGWAWDQTVAPDGALIFVEGVLFAFLCGDSVLTFRNNFYVEDDHFMGVVVEEGSGR